MLSLPTDRVLVPVDFSDLSLVALQTAQGMVRSPEGLHVVSVLAPILPPSPGVAWGTVDDRSRVDAVHGELKTLLKP